MGYKIVTTVNPGDSARFGPDDVNKYSKLLSGFDLTSTDPVDIATQTRIRSSKLEVRDPSNVRSFKIAATDGATGDVTLTIPLPSGGGTTDSFVLASQSSGAGDMVLATAQTVTGAKTFNDTKLLLRNPANTFSVTLGAGAQTAARTFTFPVTAANDTIQTISSTQTVTNKTFSGASNTFTNLPKSAIPSATLYNDVDNDLGAHFYNITQIAAPTSPSATNVRVYLDSTTGHLMAKHSDGTANDLETTSGAGVGDMLLGTAQTVTAAKTFNDTTLLLRNPADTFSSTISAGAQTGTRVFTFPVTAGNDTIDTRTATAVLANKTLSVDTSTFNHSATNAAGDLWKSDGTKMQRLARGTAGQVLQVNGGGTDVAWATLSAGSGDMILASPQTVTGAKTFNDATLLLRNPADTFSVTLGAGAQTAARTFTFPVTTGADTIQTIAATQTVTNKTMTVNGNTFKHGTTNAAGDIWKSDGTSMTRFARGTANQVLAVNSGGTDIAWTTLAAGSGDMILASAQTVTGAKTFNDATLLLRNPADTFSATLKSGAQTAAKTFTFPTSAAASDTIPMSGASNAFTGINTFLTDNLRLFNPAATFAYHFVTSAITADRNVTIPLLTGNDNMVLEAFAQTLTNKTMTAPVLSSYLDYTRIAAPANPAANFGRAYVKQIDTNNDGLFILVKKAGAYTEVQIA